MDKKLSVNVHGLGNRLMFPNRPWSQLRGTWSLQYLANSVIFPGLFWVPPCRVRSFSLEIQFTLGLHRKWDDYQKTSLQGSSLVVPSQTCRFVAHGSGVGSVGLLMCGFTWNFNTDSQTRYWGAGGIYCLRWYCGSYCAGNRPGAGRNVGNTRRVLTPSRWYVHVVLGGSECRGDSSTPLSDPRSVNSHFLLRMYPVESLSRNITWVGENQVWIRTLLFKWNWTRLRILEFWNWMKIWTYVDYLYRKDVRAKILAILFYWFGRY